MNCLYLKSKLDRTLYCKKLKKIINIKDCNNCDLKEFKQNKTSNTLKNISFRLAKQQKQRFSIINHSFSNCAECGSKWRISKNEVFEGAKRGVSMKYGFVVPLCETCHTRFHNDREFALKYKRLFQSKFEETHSRDEFLNLVHKSYL